MAGKCTLEGVLSGLVGVDEILKLNSLLDMSESYQAFANEQAAKKKP
jgi:hypothetical protein